MGKENVGFGTISKVGSLATGLPCIMFEMLLVCLW